MAAANHPDHDLIRACQLGDRRAQKTLYDRYARAMLNTAYRISGSEEDARDVLQESFVKVFANLHRFRAESTIGAWIKRIVVNTAIQAVKKSKSDLLVGLEQAPEPVAIEPQELPPVDARTARKALQQLPDGYRTVLTLYLVEGYDHQEIAQILDIGVSTSLSQYSRARKKLREIILEMNAHDPDRTTIPNVRG